MAIEIRHEGFTTQVAPPMAGELVVTPETLKLLKVPDEVLLRPESVNPFMAGQWAKWNDIVNRQEIKALEGDIPPEYFQDETALPPVQSVSREEQAALASWTQEKMMNLQSGGADVDQLTSEIDGYIDEAMKKYPDLGKEVTVDPTDMMLMEGLRESREQEEQWLELLAAARDPEMFNTIMGMRYASRVKAKLGHLVKELASVDQTNKNVLKDLGLDKDASQADIAKANMEFATYQSDRSTLLMMIQAAVSDLERITNFTSANNTQIRRPMEVMIGNMRT